MSLRGLGNRGQAGVLGFALVIGIVAVGTVAVVALGGTALDDIEQGAQNERTEIAMTQFDATAARVALGESSSQTVGLPSGESGSVSVDETAGSIKIEIDCLTGGTDTLLSSTDLGAVVYESGGTTLAYQGGGVWRQDPTGEPRMVSPPEFHYRGATLTFPVILVRGSAATDDVRVVPKNIGQQQFPDPTASICGTTADNPVASGAVKITINSQYAKAWGNYFETRTTGTASYPSPNTVVLQLTSPVRRPALTSAVAATGGGSDALDIAGTGARTDSYDSDSGDYAASQTSNGEVVIEGDVDVTGNGEVKGDVRSGGFVDVGGSGTVDDIYYTSGVSCSGTCGSETAIAGVSGPEPIDPLVTERVDDIQSNNDNSGVDIDGSNRLDWGADDEVTLTPGDYYLDRIDIEGEDLILDTTGGGTINIAVENYARIKQSGGGDAGKIKIVGDGRVNIWMVGGGSVTENIGFGSKNYNLFVGNDGYVLVDDVGSGDDKASRLYVYGTEDLTAGVGGASGTADCDTIGSNQACFQGVIYMPASSSGSGFVDVRQGDIFGGVVSGAVNVGQYGAVHYDESLRNADTIPTNDNVVAVTYLHVTTNEVDIEDS